MKQKRYFLDGKLDDHQIIVFVLLQQLLKDQPDTPTLQAGEIISTGTWTDLTPVKSGQTWSSAFSGASLAGLSVSFID